MDEQLTKTDLKKVLKMFKEITLNDVDMEEFASELMEKSETHYEKDREEKGERYQEVGEAFQELAEAFQNLYGLLEDHLHD